MEIKALRHCPFCGGGNLIVGSEQEIEKDVKKSDINFAVCCDALHGGCGAVGGYHMTIEEAINAWNRRV